jgi:hypothetical protein
MSEPENTAAPALPGYACKIDSADFSEDTVTVLMLGEYCVSAVPYRLIREDELRAALRAAMGVAK